MAVTRAKKYVVARIFEGEIQEGDLRLEEEELPPIKEGEFLAEGLYLSVDPFMRILSKNYKLGQLMIGFQVAKIVQSKSAKYPVGELVVGNLGWRTHTVVPENHSYDLYIIPETGHLPKSLSLGIIGRPGTSAYFGFLDICKPKPGETVVITAAAGAVGSHVGQIAKIKGCKVIGITGSEEKKQWIESIGFDGAINYKNRTLAEIGQDLKQLAPGGIDCYFDNVGGPISSLIIDQMNPGGRISVCGAICSYNDKSPPNAPILQPPFIFKQLEMKGFIVAHFEPKRFEAIRQNIAWALAGNLKWRETITEGFENATQALIGVMRGDNIGKAIVKIR